MAKTRSRYIQRLKDGTVKQINPFTGTEVWTVPERVARPLANVAAREPQLIERRTPESYCSFCEAKHADTPPERSRVVLEGGAYRTHSYAGPKEALKTPAEFRRIANLFEIVSYDYWHKNYGFELSGERRKWKDEYLADPLGARHVKDVLLYRFRCQGKSEEWIGANLSTRWQELADGLFGGSHELVIARHHFTKTACFDTDLAAAGEMTPGTHNEFTRFTLSGIEDIYRNNPHVLYASVFQNWLYQAGASFDHLHKQLVGLDEGGVTIEKIRRVLRKNPDAFNTEYLDTAIDEGLVVAEKGAAVCVAAFGERFPTLAILSRGAARDPWELGPTEIQDMSDLVHAAHAAMGPEVPCNEEWYYSPRDTDIKLPWFVLLKWRINNPAGFEGNTEIYINTMEPIALKEKMVPFLRSARERGRIAEGISIGEECQQAKGTLRYSKE